MRLDTRCGWRYNEADNCIEWDGGEKFYHYVTWLKYLTENILGINYELNGEVTFQGEDPDDQGIIIVKNNHIVVKVNDQKCTKKYITSDHQNIIFIKFIDLISKKDISAESFENIANEYHTKRTEILGMMLRHAITTGRPDILNCLLKIGANPQYIPKNNIPKCRTINDLINNGTMSKETVDQMEQIFFKYGFKADLYGDEPNFE